ncbi:PaaI family thioesterase [Flavobacterium subsaxonicum]|uniref:Thioesterase n=1 Tax=Flavobacterium subsaxonicum WB 4.1-42 = DSM 21790 TaxID=1121898 RepID=A0A0A2MIJ0_9FLAO|nr:PaaI family thioesterase [Flavobacterium subsaxonicum]KGO91416.1 thioesterase [Flavobacterium subsaxonicum WB 4.1-42 = DSM 21790]
MDTKEAAFLRQFIGKGVVQSPSPFMNFLRPIVLSVQEGSLAFQHTIRKEMTNPFGTLHGGVTAAIIDDAIGATLIAYGEPFFHVTINLAIDYFASAKEGDVIIAQTAVIKKGKQIVNAQCEVWNHDRTRLIAKGYTNMIKTPIN